MRIDVTVVLCAVLSLLCMGCGANFKSMRDADAYLEKDKVVARDFWNQKNKEDIEVIKSDKSVSMLRPSIRAKANGLGMGLSVLNLAVGNVGMAGAGMIASSTGRPSGRNVHMKVSGITIPCHKSYFLYSLKELGKPDWDIGREAIKLAAVPELSSPAKKKAIFSGKIKAKG